MKQYYKAINPLTGTITVWAGDNSRSSFLLTTGNFIIPCGTHKPSNVSHETIKKF